MQMELDAHLNHGNKRGESMNEKNTQSLLKLIDDLIKLVGKNVDNINKLGEEVAELKAKRLNQIRIKDNQFEINADGSETDVERFGK